MGMVTWLRSLLSSPAAADAPPASEPPPWTGYGYLGIKGESQYQPALQRIARSGLICQATLIPEPDNPFDVNAVVVKINNETVGYLSRSDARRYQRRLLALTELHHCPAKLIGGTREKPYFGVLLDCREVEHMPTPKRPRKPRTKFDSKEQPF